MKNKFITPVAMKVTKEQYEADLREPLLEMGYEDDCITDTWHEDPYLCTYWFRQNCIIGNYFYSEAARHNRHYIESYNPELFLALAAQTEGDDWIVGEWLYYKDNGVFFKVSKLSGSNHLNGCASNEANERLYRKATKEELIEHFTKKEDMKKDRFPFVLSPDNAQEIILAACSDWKKILADKWASNIVLSKPTTVNEDDYKRMRDECTSEQHKLFDDIFGKDEPEYKVGDCVIIINRGWGTSYVEQVVEIAEIDGEFFKFKPFYTDDWLSCEFPISKIERLATPEEIEKAKFPAKDIGCFVSDNSTDWCLRFSNGKGKFYEGGKKSGCLHRWKHYKVIEDQSILPEIKG